MNYHRHLEVIYLQNRQFHLLGVQANIQQFEEEETCVEVIYKHFIIPFLKKKVNSITERVVNEYVNVDIFQYIIVLINLFQHNNID